MNSVVENDYPTTTPVKLYNVNNMEKITTASRKLVIEVDNADEIIPRK